MTAFLRWLTHTHTMRWHAHHKTGGTGHLYQGRFKSFPVQDEEHFLTVCRYVERNALRANLVKRAEDWRWGSLSQWSQKPTEGQPKLSPWPIRRSSNWIDHVNEPQTEAELEALRRCVNRGSPFGDEAWSKKIVQQLGLESTLTPRGRPRKAANGA